MQSSYFSSHIKAGWLAAAVTILASLAKPINAQDDNTQLIVSQCMQLNFVTRAQWGAASANLHRQDDDSQQARLLPLQAFDQAPRRIFVHQAWDGRTCNDLDSCSIRLKAIQAYHQHVKLWPDISYNFLISGDGTIFEGVGPDRAGYHTLHYNDESIGVALIGTFHDVKPPERMLLALEQLADCLLGLQLISDDYIVHGHRDARCTICPGNAAYSRLSQLSRFRAGPLSRYSCPIEPSSPVGRSLNGSETGSSELALQKQRQQQRRSTNNGLVSLVAGRRSLIEPSELAEQQQPTTTRRTILEETIVGVLRRRRESERQASASSADTEQQGQLSSSIKNKQLILINLQQPASSRSDGATQQPLFYLLQTKTKPTLLANSPAIIYLTNPGALPSSGGSSLGGSGGGSGGDPLGGAGGGSGGGSGSGNMGGSQGASTNSNRAGDSGSSSGGNRSGSGGGSSPSGGSRRNSSGSSESGPASEMLTEDGPRILRANLKDEQPIGLLNKLFNSSPFNYVALF